MTITKVYCDGCGKESSKMFKVTEVCASYSKVYDVCFDCWDQPHRVLMGVVPEGLVKAILGT